VACSRENFTFYLYLTIYYSGDQVKKNVMVANVAGIGGEENFIQSVNTET
jgi:hypothetical protein